jgi:hypothetical protein
MRFLRKSTKGHSMKTLVLSVFSGVLFVLAANSARAQYSISWYKIAGGGGTSSNGQYSVSGTIGQHDAGTPMTGGSYSLTGGFWSLISVVQTAGSPTLTVTHSGNNVIVSWPSPSTGFVLQQIGDLKQANWATSGYTINDDGTTKSITISSPTGNLFFRLKQ